MGNDFAGLSVIVTGSGSGIGLACATSFDLQGAAVIGLDLEKGDLPSHIPWFFCDVRDMAAVTEAFEFIDDNATGLDIVVNCAGIGAIGTIETATEHEWLSVYDTNVVGTARVSAAALPKLRASAQASIVNVCSIAATVGLPERAVYSASKGAVLALTRAMAADLLSDGVRVNCVNPGTADTPWVQRLLDKADDPAAERLALAARQPMGRLITAEEVASTVCFLAHPLQSSLTGASIAVDGGIDALRTRRRG